MSQLVYQMEFRRPHMTEALNRFYDRVQIAEKYFQKEGNCDWSYYQPAYQEFDFKKFDPSISMCDNLKNFANNANNMIMSFVCMDPSEVPRRTFNRWILMSTRIYGLAVDQANAGKC